MPNVARSYTATKQEDITLIKEIIERDKDIDDLLCKYS